MRILGVKCIKYRDDRHGTWRYGISEDKIGRLVWRILLGDEATIPGQFVIKECGSLVATTVTEEQAEIITGLHSPAAMDRLRELLHESSETIEP